MWDVAPTTPSIQAEHSKHLGKWEVISEHYTSCRHVAVCLLDLEAANKARREQNTVLWCQLTKNRRKWKGTDYTTLLRQWQFSVFIDTLFELSFCRFLWLPVPVAILFFYGVLFCFPSFFLAVLEQFQCVLSHDLEGTSAAHEILGSQDLSYTERWIWKVTGQQIDC